jgi:hypothetical protein
VFTDHSHGSTYHQTSLLSYFQLFLQHNTKSLCTLIVSLYSKTSIHFHLPLPSVYFLEPQQKVPLRSHTYSIFQETYQYSTPSLSTYSYTHTQTSLRHRSHPQHNIMFCLTLTVSFFYFKFKLLIIQFTRKFN